MGGWRDIACPLKCPESEPPLQPPGAASRPASLLLIQILPGFALFAPGRPAPHRTARARNTCARWFGGRTVIPPVCYRRSGSPNEGCAAERSPPTRNNSTPEVAS